MNNILNLKNQISKYVPCNEQEENDIGRPAGSDDEQKQEYDENYNQTRT